MTGNVAVVIVSYHTGPLLFRCFDSVVAQPEVAEVIVVDNGNPAGVLARLEAIQQQNHRVKILTGHGNVGFAAGCNLGAKDAQADHLLILNPDAALPEGGLGRLLEVLHQADDDSTMVGGRLVGPDGEEQAGSRRGELTPASAFAEMTGLYRVLPGSERWNWHRQACPDKAIPVPTISGACMLLPRKAYDAIGGMDEGYFLHVEDVDFCRRFRASGGEILFCPDVGILHEKGTSAASPLRVERWKAQSLGRYFRQHFEGTYPPGVIPAVMGLVWLGVGLRGLKSALTRPSRQAQREDVQSRP